MFVRKNKNGRVIAVYRYGYINRRKHHQHTMIIYHDIPYSNHDGTGTIIINTRHVLFFFSSSLNNVSTRTFNNNIIMCIICIRLGWRLYYRVLYKSGERWTICFFPRFFGNAPSPEYYKNIRKIIPSKQQGLSVYTYTKTTTTIIIIITVAGRRGTAVSRV